MTLNTLKLTKCGLEKYLLFSLKSFDAIAIIKPTVANLEPNGNIEFLVVDHKVCYQKKPEGADVKCLQDLSDICKVGFKLNGDKRGRL